MNRLIGMSLLVIGAAGFAFASGPIAPEIDGSSASAALALISGGLVILRGRRRK